MKTTYFMLCWKENCNNFWYLYTTLLFVVLLNGLSYQLYQTNTITTNTNQEIKILSRAVPNTISKVENGGLKLHFSVRGYHKTKYVHDWT